MSVAMPTLGVFVGFAQTANTGAWTLGTSELGTGTVLGQAFIYVYTDIAGDLRSFLLQRGKSREMDVYQAGTVTAVLDNRSRDYDPLNLAGPYVTGGVTDVKPGRPCYITATHPTTGAVITIFRGRVRGWKLDYTGQFDSTVTLTVTDALTELANVEIDTTTSAGTSGAAAAEVFVAAGVTQFVADEGLSTVQATAFTRSALEALRTLERSEQGAVYVEANGDVVFASRASLVSEDRSRVSQATFGAGSLDYREPELDYDSDLIKNVATVTRTGGVAQTATNQDSVDAYGKRSLTLTGLANSTDAEVLNMAAYLVGRYGEPLVRVKKITLMPQKNEQLMTQALVRRLRDRVTVTFAPVGGGAAISQEVFLTGIRHELAARSGMKTVFSFEPTEWSFGWLLGTDALGAATLGF